MPQSFPLLLDQVNQVASAKGKAKEVVLASFPDPDTAWKPMLCYALDPHITFNIGKKTITQIEKSSGIGSSALIWENAKALLDKLSSRELTGKAAFSAISELRERHCEDSWELLKRILVKDLRGSFSAKTLNAVWEDIIWLFEVQLAKSYSPKHVKQWPVDAEVKYDGVRCAAEIDMKHDRVIMRSREGNVFPMFKKIEKDVLSLVRLALPETVGTFYMDGEIMSGEFNKTSGDIHRKDVQIEDAVFRVFDFLTHDEFWEKNGKKADISPKRRKRFQALFVRAGCDLILPDDPNIKGVSVKDGHYAKFRSVRLNEQYEVENDESVQALFDYFYDSGEEGIIIKPRNCRYQRKRNANFLKLKGEITEDLKIVGFENGERDTKFEHVLGALVVDYNGVEVRVSSGLKEHQRFDFWKNRDQLIGRIIEVQAHQKTPDGSLRHPRFIRFRDTLKAGVKE
ncbi:TPA: hypothetical protein ACPKAL_003668 [Vibrio alginolyticus]|uniref:ATP-dependent DNA ligase n=1 Tax=Vibrio alginolyticus TaxID=663 RepID=UPI00063DB44F|nr:hypothetical protein [Vibrio alginolyticus]HCG5484208.1 hypothetical protein [Vibrio parahaemolyticus]KLI71177.1 hypothetical protein AAW26_16810 [Vibrio alginolyticus]MDM4739668.1 hypothetical protein [Vibrio alginolyticus]MDM4760017.1 hypothetical protein [Vibrio alginolyticus]HCH3308196.1 hypothetical protein [Vibrio parahaemolyticus]